MIEEQPKRKPRVPLSKEELYYFIQLKKLREVEKLEHFKATRFYKIVSKINIVLSAVVTYGILSILVLTNWQNDYIARVNCILGEYNRQTQQSTFSEVQLKTATLNDITIKTPELTLCPEIGQTVYIGKDFIFGKTLKCKLSYDNRTFWTISSYASISICLFALVLSLFIYKVNKHLSINGLITVLGLLSLASLYFIFI